MQNALGSAAVRTAHEAGHKEPLVAAAADISHLAKFAAFLQDVVFTKRGHDATRLVHLQATSAAAAAAMAIFAAAVAAWFDAAAAPAVCFTAAAPAATLLLSAFAVCMSAAAAGDFSLVEIWKVLLPLLSLQFAAAVLQQFHRMVGHWEATEIGERLAIRKKPKGRKKEERVILSVEGLQKGK